jgi:DNA primase
VPKDAQGIKTGKPYLIPEIEALAIPGREIYICFDQDQNPKTVQNVSYEILKLGRLLEFKKCQVKVIEWDSALGKGIDDLIFAHGVEAFSSAYEKALLLKVG